MKLLEITRNSKDETKAITSMERLIFFKPRHKIGFSISTDVQEAYQPAGEVSLELSVPHKTAFDEDEVVYASISVVS